MLHHKITGFETRTVAVSIGLILVALLLAIPVSAQDSRNQEGEDDGILRACDVEITRYVNDYRVEFDVREEPEGQNWLMLVDGQTNENHRWGTRRTERGMGFTIPYTAADAGTSHTYRVAVSRHGKAPFCESDGTFRVKGG